jgi:phosphoserine phosphatase
MRGEVDFATSLRSRVRRCGCAAERLRPRAGARRADTGAPSSSPRSTRAGGIAAVVSGGFHEILDVVAPALGVDTWRANRLASDAVCCPASSTARSWMPRQAALREWAWRRPAARPHDRGGRRRERPADDGRAGLGVAFNAKPAVRGRPTSIGPVDLRELIPLLP